MAAAWILPTERVVVRNNGMILVLNDVQYQKWDSPNSIIDGPMTPDEANSLAKELAEKGTQGEIVTPWF